MAAKIALEPLARLREGTFPALAAHAREPPPRGVAPGRPVADSAAVDLAQLPHEHGSGPAPAPRPQAEERLAVGPQWQDSGEDQAARRAPQLRGGPRAGASR
jgi:hypothetical protein